MANITHFDPFNVSGRNSLDDVFEGFFRPVLVNDNVAPRIKVDVQEDKDSYKIHADIPGVKKEDIHVTVEGNQISISAESRQEKEVKEGTKVLRSERYYGKVSRSFYLDNEIDGSKTDAEYKDGVLELNLPKKVATSSNKVTIR